MRAAVAMERVYGSSGGEGGGATTAPVFPCDDPIHGCDKEQATHNLNIDQLKSCTKRKIRRSGRRS